MASNRYTLIDGVRGIAAVAVLLWHYQHFFMRPDRVLPVVETLDLPFRPILDLAYQRGYLGVVLFWTISGFVFFYAYRGRATSTRGFAVNRFARLYPLHLITLLVVLALQTISLRLNGQWEIYGNNDVPHFIQHIFFIAREGVDAAFNAPIWSVSVELVIYAAFWIVHRRLENYSALWASIIALAFAVLFKMLGGNIALCGFYFFLGCICASWHAEVGPRLRLLIVIVLFIGGTTMFQKWGDAGPLKNGVAPIAMALILTLASAEKWTSSRLQRICENIGDCSYGLYLWHIPVQLTLILLFGAATPDLAKNGWFLASFLALTSGLAALGYRVIERPARDWIRDKL